MLRKSLITITMVALLGACSDSDYPGPTPPTTPVPTPVERTIDGRAIKGVISNAVVTVFKYVDGVAVELTADELTDANIITGDDGSYTVTILDYAGPVKVVLTPSTDPANPTTMVCDAPSGCGEIAFGETIDLTDKDPSFSLSSIAVLEEDSTTSLRVNVSALTHLAAALTEADPDGVTSESIQSNASIIANNFGIEGDILTLEPSIMTAEGVAGEDNAAELRYGLINAGIMAAIFSGEGASDGILSTKLAEAIADLVANDGAMLVNQDDSNSGFELSLADVLAGAAEAAEEIVELILADSSLTGTEAILADLSLLETTFENDIVYAEATQGEDGRGSTEVEVVVEGDAIAKAKAMVSDVRLFTRLFEESSTGEVVDGSAVSDGEQYTDLINAAGDMIDAEAESFLLIAELSEVLSEIGMEVEDGSTQTTFNVADYLSIAGAAGTIVLDEENLIFTINAQIGSTETVLLDAALVLAEDGLSAQLDFSGSIDSAGATFTLADGSFAKLMLDTAATREALEDDTYEGDITSGELELMLTLMQKTTDTITNPVSFEGAITAKLLPVTRNTIEHRNKWTNSGGDWERVQYFEKETEIDILPEMLTLSGEFSSLAGNVIDATLTLNIQDIDSYQAPRVPFFGDEVTGIMDVVVSENMNTATATTTDKVSDGFVRTITFTAGTSAGNWSYVTATVQNDDEEEFPNNASNHSVSRSTDTVGEQDVIIYKWWGTGWANLTIITFWDTDEDSVNDKFDFKRLAGAEFNNEGNLVTYNGVVITLESIVDGTVEFWNEHNMFFDTTLAEVEEHYALQPAALANAAQAAAFELEHFYDPAFILADGSGNIVSIFADKYPATLASLAAGDDVSFNAHVSADALIEDVFTVEVGTDSNSVETTFGDTVRTYTFAGAGDGNFVADIVVLKDEYEITKTITSSTEAITGIDLPQLNVNMGVFYPDDEYYELRKFVPMDSNQDGVTDHFVITTFWADDIDENGNYIDYQGNIAVPFVDNSEEMSVDGSSYDAIDWANTYKYSTPYNPMEVTNALDIFSGRILNRFNGELFSHLEEIGEVRVDLSSADLMALAPGTVMFDGQVTYPENTDVLENMDTFLGANAALSLGVVLGDYEVDLTLSGLRTEFEDGRFSLIMSYNLPDEEAHRSFTVHASSADQETTFRATNSDGVLIVMNEEDDTASSTTSDVIGSIFYGADALKVADIEDRDGIIFVVYTDGTTETF